MAVKKSRKQAEEEDEDDAEGKKRPVEGEDGKLVKKPVKKEGETETEEEREEAAKAKKQADEETEDETKKNAETEEDEETEKAEDLEPLTEDEQKVYRACKAKLKAYRKMKKGEGSAQSPEESNEQAASSGEATISPGATTPSKPQNKFDPPTDVDGKRTQDTPAGDADVNKQLEASPLYKSLSRQIDDTKKALDAKLDAVAKSQKDRLVNMQKGLDKFYNQSFYKAAGENVPPEGTQLLSVKKQIADGKARMKM